MKKGSWLSLLVGILAANFVGVASCYAIYFLFQLLGRIDRSSSLGNLAGVTVAFAVWPSLILMPMAMGLVAAFFWRNLGLGPWRNFAWWFVTTLVALVGACIFFREGTVCLVLASPILFTCGFGGVMIGANIFRSRPTTMNMSVLPLLLVLMLAEGGLRRDRERVVEDRLRVDAGIATVWPHLVAFPRIEKAPDYWLNRIGLPSPSETTCQGPFVGARRECIFNDGLVFEEVVSEVKPAQILTFQIVKQPDQPELLGHLTLHRGQFELVANDDGTTTLIGRSWYTLHMHPGWYFDWWTRDVTSHVHLRVMEHIKALSELRQ